MLNIKAKLSLGFLTLLTLLALGSSFVGPDPNHFNPSEIGRPQSPSLTHPFGTDDFGRDVLVRTLHGARISLAVGCMSALIALIVGLWIGALAGFLGGWIDEALMRFIDLLMALPTIFLILIIQVLFKPSLFNVMAVIGLTGWMGMARMVRAEVLSVRERLFVTAAHARGISRSQILFKHILPHTLNPVIVSSMLGVGSAILTESVLSFLGLGVQPPFASWGNMLENSLNYMQDAPWLTLVPGLFITLTVLSLNFIGDSLRASLKGESHA